MNEKKYLKENTRSVSFAFRLTKDLFFKLDEIAKECSRTKSLQCEFFLKKAIAEYLENKKDGEHERLLKSED